MANEIKRLYRGSDAHMAASSRVTRTLMLDDLPAFTAFDSTIDSAFATEWLAKIVAADSVVRDDVVIDEVVETTEYVSGAMKRAKRKYHQVKYFVQKAFPESVGIQGQFGLNDYMDVRRNTEEMVTFMTGMYDKCIQHKVILIAKGYSQARIDEILDIKQALIDTNNVQEATKKDRPKRTEDRIIILNDCYSVMALVNAAAQLVYEDDYAKQNQFVYDPSPASGEDNGSIDDLSGTVEPSSVKTVTTIDEDAEITMSNTGTEKLYFALSPTEGAGGIDFTVQAGETLTKSTSDMSPDGDGEFLLVKNPETVIGSYEVVVIV